MPILQQNALVTIYLKAFLLTITSINTIVVSKMNDKFSLRDYPLKAASLYVSALSFILENTIAMQQSHSGHKILLCKKELEKKCSAHTTDIH
ncbi:UNVERIFIED_CONTAM: hypothetical protein LBW93_04835 [Wolbachia endosymbiont of Nasonia longicornis]